MNSINNSIPSKQPGYIINKTLDILFIGGLSILLALFFLLSTSELSSHLLLQKYVLLTTVINGPHFLQSLRLLYKDRDTIMRHKSASIYLPFILAFYGIWAIAWAVDGDGHYVNLMLVVLAIYLAQHYTAQTWGMLSTFTRLEGINFTLLEYSFLRNSLRVLMAWQIIWTLNLPSVRLPMSVAALMPDLTTLSNIAIILTVPFCLYCFIAAYRRESRMPLRVWVPLAALYCWYAVLWKHPGALFWAQIHHSLQYIIFPFRIELNRQKLLSPGTEKTLAFRMFLYCCILVVLSYFIFIWLQEQATSGMTGFQVYPLVLMTAIQLHHFYTDNCIWKIQRQEVAKDLFMHLK